MRWLRDVRPDTFRAAFWALRSCIRVHRSAGVIAGPALPRVPDVPSVAFAGVRHVLWMRGEQCLVSSYVRQAWLASHGDARELVVGTTGPAGFAAHAWLDGEEATEGVGFHELIRLPPPGSPR
jgi:hypothetical protein